ncbi:MULTISPECIES: flagellar assembly protein FliH [Lysinibacillus]|uniref:Flagellar assembly protein FliH n=1 Tax=Lysinibacillus fusiformis TaxID=28031 RepID=A0A2I0V4Q4_9BACI|nr:MULTISPECIES: flagellar assembly protein FliH [Lysinibacillus]KUF36464.1 flagellar assembly protein FliH [Lysinibacillus sp. F5]MEE3807014.1 flagellar assembly protein FliH [Lysinibacillus fusiformis]PKU53273.1 flagellar assembly protein FliH [Lysinibacillus fusiformis]
MSRIIRSIYTQSDSDSIKEIQIRDMFEPIEVDQHEVSSQHQLTLDEIMAERDRLLAEARATLQAEREMFEQEKQLHFQEIEHLKLNWEEERPNRVQEAYDEGFGQGYEDGMNKASEAMAQSLQTANEVMIQAKQNAQKYIEDQEAVILELGLTAAERIIGTSLEQDNELFVSIVRRGLKEAREMKEIKIYVSPTYYALITTNRDELAEMFPMDVPFMIFVNEDLDNETDCYIETNHGRIMVSIDEQLNELRLKLHEILESKE